MAKKSFEIQGSTLRIGGLDLEAGNTSIVIPGVTRATSYSVDKVKDNDNDQEITFNDTPVIIDIVMFNDYFDHGSTAMRAEYQAELDDDGYIDDIKVNFGGVYSVQEYNDIMGATSLLAYTGTELDPFATFVSDDWTSIPFRVKMQAEEVENISGSGSLGDIEVTVDNDEGNYTRLTVANKDFEIYTTREDSDQDADIVLESADDVFIRANGDEVSISATNSVSISSNVNEETITWEFRTDGKLSLPPGGDIVDWEGNSVLGSAVDINSNIWVQTFESDNPENDNVAAASSVEYDAEGNIIALFNHAGAEPGSYSSIAKFDTNGTKLWQTRFSNAVYTDGWGLAVDPAGDYTYVTGYINNDAEYDNVFLSKFDNVTGQSMWGKKYDFGADSQAPVVDVDNNGYPIIVGYALGSTPDNQIIITKINHVDGAVVWSRALDGLGDEAAYGMAVGPDNEIIAVGYAQQNAADGIDGYMLVTKYDTDGIIQWQKTVQFDAGYSCSGADADVDSNGNIYVTGQYQYDNNGGTTSALSIVKFDSIGVAQWSRRIVGNCDTFGNSIVVGPDDKLYLSGVTGNDNTDDYSWVAAKYNLDGTVAWQRLIDNTSTWSFGTAFFMSQGGGSNLAVKNGYAVFGGLFGDPFQNEFHAAIVQVDSEGTPFSVGDWDFKAASFSGLLNSSASDLTIADAGKTDLDVSNNITVSDTTGDPDSSNFLIGTRYSPGTVSTGNITFTGIKIIGDIEPNDLNAGGIKLIPNPAHEETGQYVKIYPTMGQDAPHIHIAAGTGGDLILGDDTRGVDVNHDDNIYIKTYGGTYSWKFGADGQTTFPTLTVPISDNATPSGTGQTLKFSDPSQQAIIYGPPSTADYPYAERIIIQGAPGYTGTTGEGGDVYLWAGPGGDAGGGGGDIKVRAGAGQGTGQGGYLKFQAGDSGTGTGGFISIESGSGTTGGSIEMYARNGGNIDIRAVDAGTVAIHTEASAWTFGTDGKTTLPGAVVKSTVAKTGADVDQYGRGTATAVTTTPSDNPSEWQMAGPYGNTDIDINGVTVTCSIYVTEGGALELTVVSSSFGNMVGDTGILDGTFTNEFGSETFDMVTVTVSAVSGLVEATALDLTKSTNKLTDGVYSLADGVEGQIMYLVPQPGLSQPFDVKIVVSTFRASTNNSTGGLLFPFIKRRGTIDPPVSDEYNDICTLIFTDGAWQQTGGIWD